MSKPTETLGASRFDKPILPKLIPNEVLLTQIEYPDHVEFGTPKYGAVKIYFNADNLLKAKLRVANSLAVKLFAVRLFSDETMTEKSAEQFIQDIVEEINNGKH